MIIIKAFLFIIYILGGIFLLGLATLSLYAKNLKIGVPSAILGILSLIESYESITYKNPLLFWMLFFLSVAVITASILYLQEPDLGIIDRFKSPKRLLSEGKKEKAALKLKRDKKYIEAAKIYEELGWLSSATFCYEEAGDWEKAADLYLKMADKEDDSYNLRKAREIFEEKLKNFEKAAEILERMAKSEGWYWEDAAKLWEKVGKDEEAKRCWQNSLAYYMERAKEDDGVFLSDVAKIYEKLGMVDEACDAYKRFLDYSLSMVEKEDRGWIRHVAETCYAIFRLKGEAEFKEKGDRYLENYKAYLDETVKDDNYKKELIEKVKRWAIERVENEL